MRNVFSLVIIVFLLLSSSLYAQQEYTVNGETQILFTEIEGPLTILYKKSGKEYHFYSKKDDEIVALENTKIEGKHQEEYKAVLQGQTRDASISTDKVRLTPRSLAAFAIDYNSAIDPEFSVSKQTSEIEFRLGGFAGVDNAVYTVNPENALLPVVGLEFEILDLRSLKRHALVVQFRQTFENSDYKYNSSQLAVNYRFKFIKSSKFDTFVNAKFATVTFSNYEYEAMEEGTHELKTYSQSSSGLNAPFLFGLGADYRLGNGYITLGINDLVGLNVDTNSEFPINLTLGYKFIL